MNNRLKFLLIYTLIMVILNMIFQDNTRRYINLLGLFGYIVIGGIYFVLFLRKS